MMEVDCSETVASTPCTPQRVIRQFDPTQPSTSSSGMATPLSTMSTPRMMTSSTAASTPIVIKYDNEGASTPSSSAYYNPATPTRPQGAYNPGTPGGGKMNNYPTTPGRSTSRLSIHGPIQSSPFRQQPQNLMPGPANERVHQLREAAIAKQNYMQQWMGSGYSAPSPQQQQQRRPPSMVGSTMSSMSHMSDMSRFSIGGMSTLSVNTEIANYSWPQNPNQAPHILSKVSSQGSSVENQDPMKAKRRMTFDELIFNLKSSDSNKQMLSLKELIPPAQQNQLEALIMKPQLEDLVYTLFEVLLPRENEDEKVVEAALYVLYHAVLHPTQKRTRNIFAGLNQEIMERVLPSRTDGANHPPFNLKHPLGIFWIIMYRSNQIESRYVTKAWMLLTHLLCNTLFKRQFFSEKRNGDLKYGDEEIRANVIRFAVDSLKKELKSKPKGFAVSVVRNLSSANSQIMAMAMQMGVIEIFLNIMKEETIHEDLLWSTTQALSAFFALSINGEAFIRMGGTQVICGLLSHGSSRLLHELLGCMARVADLPAIKEQNMREPIHNIVQLLGSFDPTIVERSTAILMNIGLHEKSNKMILLQCGVTNHVFAVLRMSDQYSQLATNPQHSEVIRQQIANIYEHCLSILFNVTLMGRDDNPQTAIEACKMISMNSDSAAALLNFICIGKRYCRKLAINILKRVVETVPSYAERFVDLYATTNEQLPLLLLKRVWESLQQWRTVNREILESKNGPKNDSEKKRKDHEEIVMRSAKLLTSLCLDSNPRFMEDVKKAMISGGANPFLFLSHEISDPMLDHWLTFIWRICNSADSMKSNLLLMLWMKANLHQTPFMRELYEFRTNKEIRKLIQDMGNLAQNQQMAQQMNQTIVA